jgi:arginine N-succinyltransferase
VVEDPDGTLVGTSAVAARVGGFDPFFTYELRAERVVHPPLGVDRVIQVLHLLREHKGPSELHGLVVDPSRRGRGLGRLASLGRLAFVAAHPARFAESTIAEIRGYQDAEGRSPFWDAVGRVFFAPADFADADLLTGLGEKDFVNDLMPRHPIYLDLLPAPVREAIGRPHAAALPAVRLLEGEGFARTRGVDIFDAGPILECPTAAIRTVRKARRARAGRVGGGGPEEVPAIVATPGPAGFRAVRCRVLLDDGGDVLLDRDSAARLGVEAGAELVVAEDPRG